MKVVKKPLKRPVYENCGSGYISLPRQRSFVDAVDTYSHVKKQREGGHNDSATDFGMSFYDPENY